MSGLKLRMVAADELERLLGIDSQHRAMCVRLRECCDRHALEVDGTCYIDQVLSRALDDSAGF